MTMTKLLTICGLKKFIDQKPTTNGSYNVKSKFSETFITCSAQISPKIKNAKNLCKFGTFDILNNPISNLMSEMIFMKYLPLVRPKLVPPLKMLRVF